MTELPTEFVKKPEESLKEFMMVYLEKSRNELREVPPKKLLRISLEELHVSLEGTSGGNTESLGGDISG